MTDERYEGYAEGEMIQQLRHVPGGHLDGGVWTEAMPVIRDELHPSRNVLVRMNLGPTPPGSDANVRYSGPAPTPMWVARRWTRRYVEGTEGTRGAVLPPLLYMAVLDVDTSCGAAHAWSWDRDEAITRMTAAVRDVGREHTVTWIESYQHDVDPLTPADRVWAAVAKVYDDTVPPTGV